DRPVGRSPGARVPRRARTAIRPLRQAIHTAPAGPARGRASGGENGHRAGLGVPGPRRSPGGDLAEATKALERARAVPQPPPDEQADTLFLAGEIALARRDADAAVAAFEGLLVGPPALDGYEVRVRLGLAEIHRKKSAAAEAHLRRAIELDP